MIMATPTVNLGLNFFRNHLVGINGHRFLSMFSLLFCLFLVGSEKWVDLSGIRRKKTIKICISDGED